MAAGLALAALALHAPAAHAKDATWIGLDRDMRAEGVFALGDRWGKSGKQFYAVFEAAGFGKVSPLGNLAGLEGGMAMGYDGVPYKANDQLLGDMGFLFDMWVGFPVTFFHVSKGRAPSLMVGMAPGMGVSMVSAYTYLKLKGAARVGGNLVAELQWTWWPGAASIAVGDTNDSVNAGALRATVFLALDRKTSFYGFFELYSASREGEVSGTSGSGANQVTGGNSSKVLFGGRDPFGATKRSDYEDFKRFGVGYAF